VKGKAVGPREDPGLTPFGKEGACKRSELAALALAAKRKDLEAFLGGERLYLRGPEGLTQVRVGEDLPDPVHLVAGHYQAEPGDEELYLVLFGAPFPQINRRGEGGVLGKWDAERDQEAAEVWRWVMAVKG